jgi:hypothetical protein
MYATPAKAALLCNVFKAKQDIGVHIDLVAATDMTLLWASRRWRRVAARSESERAILRHAPALGAFQLVMRTTVGTYFGDPPSNQVDSQRIVPHCSTFFLAL